MKYFIGIDPDSEKSGIAFYNKESKELFIFNLSFFNVLEYLKTQINQFDMKDILVVIEAGWLNKGNRHINDKQSNAMIAKIGENVGRNHETGKKILEMVTYLNMNHKIVKPKKSKVNHKTFQVITGFKTKTNQEQRDAAMLVFGM